MSELHAQRHLDGHPDLDLHSLRCHGDQPSEIRRRLTDAFNAGLKLGMQMGSTPGWHQNPNHGHHPTPHVAIKWTDRSDAG